MALNIELKIHIDSQNDMIKVIEKNKGEFINLLRQKDTYYNYQKGLLKLREQNDEFQLVKYNRNENEGERWSDYSVLYLKGEDAEIYFNDLFKIEAVVEKERELYIYKNTRIHLDKVKNLGKFLELETVVKNITKEEAVIEFNEVVGFLELDVKNQIKKSYRDLLIEKGK